MSASERDPGDEQQTTGPTTRKTYRVPGLRSVIMQTGQRQPHRCPVCGGKGSLPQGFYDVSQTGFAGSTTVVATDPCRSCGQTGIVWG